MRSYFGSLIAEAMSTKSCSSRAAAYIVADKTKKESILHLHHQISQRWKIVARDVTSGYYETTMRDPSNMKKPETKEYPIFHRELCLHSRFYRGILLLPTHVSSKVRQNDEFHWQAKPGYYQKDERCKTKAVASKSSALGTILLCRESRYLIDEREQKCA